MSEITDEMLMAFADGQLAAADRRRVADYIATRPEARARVEMFKKTGADLGTMFNQAFAEPIPAKLLAAVNGAPSRPFIGEVVQGRSFMSSIYEAIIPSWPKLITSGGFAATFVIGAVVGSHWYSKQPSGIQWQDMVALNEGRILAKGDFRLGLEKTPLGVEIAVNDGSNQIAFTPVMTFERKDGGYCRQYNLANKSASLMVGVGCRTGAGDWSIEVQSEAVRRKTDPADVRSAGAITPLIVDKAVDKIIKGDVLTKEREAPVLARGWRQKLPD